MHREPAVLQWCRHGSFPPSSISNAVAPPATRIASTANPGCRVPPNSTSSGTLRIWPSGSAPATRAPSPCAAVASPAGGATRPFACQMSGTDMASLVSTGVAGKTWAALLLSSPNPSTAGAAVSASAKSRSPSGHAAASGAGACRRNALAEKRSSPSRRMSIATTAGFPEPTAPTNSANRARGQGQGPKRASVSRSISMIAISGPAIDRSGNRGRRRSSARSRSGVRMIVGGRHQIPIRITSDAV